MNTDTIIWLGTALGYLKGRGECHVRVDDDWKVIRVKYPITGEGQVDIGTPCISIDDLFLLLQVDEVAL